MVIIGILLFFILLCTNFYVQIITKGQIKTREESEEKMECILVLGAGIIGNKPSHMLEDRLLEAIALYEKGL